MAMNQQFDQVSGDAQISLTEFDAAFMQAFQAAGEPWATSLGKDHPSSAIKTVYPVPVTAAGYEEFKGDARYRRLLEKSLEILKKGYQDGVAELESIVNAPDFIGWASEPAAMGHQAAVHWNSVLAKLLKVGETTACWDGEFFFSDSHPFNVFDVALGTFDNLHTNVPISATNLGVIKERFRKIKSPNGVTPLGLRLTHIGCPPAQEESWRDVLERDLIVESNAAVDNRHKGTVKLVVMDELEEDDWYYPLALNKPGMFPWVVQHGPLITKVLDSSSALNELKGMVGFDARMDGGVALGMPACIARYKRVA